MNHQFGPAQTFYDKSGVAKVKKNENPILLKQKNLYCLQQEYESFIQKLSLPRKT